MSLAIRAWIALLLTLAAPALALKPGEEIMPFTSNVVTGPYRGMQHCYVCDARGAQSCLVAFFGQCDAASAKFTSAFRSVLTQGQDPPLAWFVFLTDAGSGPEALMEDRVERLATKSGLTRLNLTVLGDPDGPPGYLVDRSAALTVLLYKRFIVKQARSWPRTGWNEAVAEQAGRDVLKALTDVIADPTIGNGPIEAPGPPPGFAPALKKE